MGGSVAPPPPNIRAYRTPDRPEAQPSLGERGGGLQVAHVDLLFLEAMS
jgi:hypothetical protein